MGITLPCSTTLPHSDHKSKKAESLLAGIDNLRLCLVQGEFQFRQDTSQHLYRAFRSPPAQDNDVVRISHDSCPKFLLQLMPFPYPVQYVQVKIRQQRRDYSTLRCAFAVSFSAPDVPFLTILILFHDRGFEPQLNEAQYLPIADALGNNGHEISMGNGVKVFAQVRVDDFGVSSVQSTGHIIDCVMG